MRLLVIILCLIESRLTFDFPIPFDRAEVAFQQRRLSKYYDLVSGQWRDTDEGFKQTYFRILTFCQTVYPDHNIIQVHQSEGPPETLSFCRIKDASRCSDIETITWVCVSRDTMHSVAPTATLASTASPQITTRCYNETSESIAYDVCTPIQSVVDSNYCSDNNLTVNKMDNVKTCSITDQDGDISNGLISADLQCCSKIPEGEGYSRPNIATIPRSPNDNHPFWPLGPDTIHPTSKPNINLTEEWCDLKQVEEQYKNMTDANVELMKEIYAQRETNGDLLLQLQSISRDLNEQVVKLYSEHFECLIGTVQQKVDQTKLSLDLMTKLQNRDSFVANIANVNISLQEVNMTFSTICTHLLNGTSNDFSNEYKKVVSRVQELRHEIEEISSELEEAENCVECETDVGYNDNTHPSFDNDVDLTVEKEDEEEEDGSKLRNQKYLIVIVSTVSCITILVALVFFILVVRRTLHKDAGRFTALPSADILTNEQYVAFLQRNGYSNPTCKLPQKYLDDYD